jgi:glycosyltransferase involved in cell wall biosynthesis
MTMLSICIPTYNRSGYLDRILASLSDQLSCDVEVVILDNASTDDTGSVVRKWQEIRPGRLRYEVRDRTIVGNANIAEAARAGTGAHVWVLGDDDIIPPGTVGRILTYAREGNDFVILNHAVYDRGMEKVRCPRWYALRTDANIRGRDAAMAFLGPTPGFISSVIARRGILDSLDGVVLDRYVALGFNQMYAFYNGLSETARGVVTADILLLVRGNDFGIYTRWEEVFVSGIGTVLTDLRRLGYGRWSVNRALGQTVIRYHIGRAVDLKKAGQPAWLLFRTGFRHYCWCWEYWCVLTPLALPPAPVVMLACKARLWLKRGSSLGGRANT